MSETETIASHALREVIRVLKTEDVLERVVRIDVSRDRCLVELRPLQKDAGGNVIDDKTEAERVTARSSQLRRDLPGASLPRDLR